jgi:glyoxylase-like metal-dependent hydrolase (beta-lactamase superfamily II)
VLYRRLNPMLFGLFFLAISIGSNGYAAETDQGFSQPLPDSMPELYQWTDTCNVFVLRDGPAAILFDLGTGDVLEELSDLGIESVDWILLTHHHREQCQGIEQVDRETTRIAGPWNERDLFENPLSFRHWHPQLGDPFSVYGASYVRPPQHPISMDRLLADQETFEWKNYRIRCLDTPGHSPGNMTYVVSKGDFIIALAGGLIHHGSKMNTWFDTEWDYGFGIGIDTMLESVGRVLELQPDVVLPAQGPMIPNAVAELEQYQTKLTEFREDYVRGYPVFDSTEQQRDPISQPTVVPLISQVTPHVYKLSHQTQGKNFAIIISDNGRGLILDAGLFPEAMLDEIILGLRQHMGLKQIDAFWISHMHGDHFLLGPTLKSKYQAQAWTLDRIADKCENPRRYDYAALVSAYSDGFDGMPIDKRFKDGESIEWEGFKIQVDWMPGQTEFGCCLWLDIDGKRLAFTGDNLFGSPADEAQNGHEAVVARNSAIFEEGYLLGSQYLLNLKPDIVMGSHSFVMPEPESFLQRYHAWSKRIIQHYQDLLPGENYEYRFDPYWVSAYPYRVDLSQTDQQTVKITVRNFRSEPQSHRVALVLPPGVVATPEVLEGTLAPQARVEYEVLLEVDRTEALPGLQMVPLDITLDQTHFGQWFDFILRTSVPQKE